MDELKDDRLWRIARKRAEFKKSLYSYIIVNLFMWAIWWFTAGHVTGFTGIPWPLWVMLGWGLGLAKQYYDAYNGNKGDMTQKEYERLKSERDRGVM